MKFKVPRKYFLVYWPQSHRIFAILYFNNKFFDFFSILASLATPTRKYNVWDSRAWVILPGDDFRFNPIYCNTNTPCDCGQYTRIFSQGTLNCMDVVYCPTPTVEGNITHPWNSRYRENIFLYIDHSHIEYLLYY
jgi:hypothetical protein